MSDTSYKLQWEILKSIKLKEGQYLRLDCPGCKGLNCFGIERNGGVTSWGCFRASCDWKGRHSVGFTREGIRTRLGYDKSIRSSNDDPSPIPTPLVAIDTHNDILEWLSSVNALRAYNDDLVDITYSPTEDRVMFKIPNVKGYVGRHCGTMTNSRTKMFGPKWRNYGDTSTVFSCGNGETGVIVEDAPSACAVGVVDGLTGLALLGTKLTTAHKVALRKYKRLIVCLDPDAALKSIEFSRRLSGVSNVSVKIIPDDLKRFNPTQIEEMLCSISYV